MLFWKVFLLIGILLIHGEVRSFILSLQRSSFIQPSSFRYQSPFRLYSYSKEEADILNLKARQNIAELDRLKRKKAQNSKVGDNIQSAVNSGFKNERPSASRPSASIPLASKSSISKSSVSKPSLSRPSTSRYPIRKSEQNMLTPRYVNIVDVTDQTRSDSVRQRKKSPDVSMGYTGT